MTWTETAAPCPLPAPEGVTAAEDSVYTGTACLALMDRSCAAEVWEDLLYDGHDHDHGDGGLMLNRASIGTHVEYDGDFPARLLLDADGKVRGFEVNLDPYAQDLDSLRRPADWSHGDEGDHDHGHHHGEHPDGWSDPVTIALDTDTAVFGDPAGLPEADNTGGLLDLVFPAGCGTLRAATFASGGHRRRLVAVWSA